MEARKDVRVRVGMPIRIRIQDIDSFTEEYTADLSAGGMFVEMEDPPEPGTVVHLEFCIEMARKSFWATGEVVRAVPEAGRDRPAGAGIEFLDLEPDGRRFIEMLVQKYRRRHPGRSLPLVSELPERILLNLRASRERHRSRGSSVEIRMRAPSRDLFREENYESLWNREIFVETDDPLPVGMPVRLRVTFERENRGMALDCEVVRHHTTLDAEREAIRRGMVLATPEHTLPLRSLLEVPS